MVLNLDIEIEQQLPDWAPPDRAAVSAAMRQPTFPPPFFPPQVPFFFSSFMYYDLRIRFVFVLFLVPFDFYFTFAKRPFEVDLDSRSFSPHPFAHYCPSLPITHSFD
jgi:hypothetical protein